MLLKNAMWTVQCFYCPCPFLSLVEKKSLWCESQKTWSSSSLVLPLTGYVTSGRSHELSRPQLPHHQLTNDLFFLINLFFNGRILALLNFAVFCQTSTWISHRYTYVPSLLNLPPAYRWPLRSLSAPHFYNKEQAEDHLLLKGLEVGQKKMSKRKEALGHMTGVRKGLSPLL